MPRRVAAWSLVGKPGPSAESPCAPKAAVGLYSLAGPQVSREFPGTDSVWGLLSRLNWPLAMPLPRPTAHAGNSESAFFAWIISLK